MPSTISPTLFDWELDSNPTGALNWKVSETNNGSGSGPTDNSLVGKLRENVGGPMGLGAKGAKVEVEALKKKTNRGEVGL